jgi:hypothetical protein
MNGPNHMRSLINLIKIYYDERQIFVKNYCWKINIKLKKGFLIFLLFKFILFILSLLLKLLK